MNLESVSIPIEPRTTGGCLDMAMQFQRLHLRPVLVATAILAVPGLVATYYLATVTDSGLLWGLLLFYALSPIVGSWLCVGAGRAVFGDAFRVRDVLLDYGRHALRLTFLLWWYRAASLVAHIGVVTGVMVAVRGASLPEAVLLEQLRGARLRHRLGELSRGIQSSPTMSFLGIWIYTLGATVSLFLLAHFSSDLLLGAPLWYHSGEGPAAALDRLTYDPVTVTALMACLWALYPVARLAWFFVYLDQRIRNECWDVELDFRREARRLSI